MRPYIILNGMSSTLIDGLLISELPAITKPQVRREITEIDGRDGSIVTKLGYESYEKEITIGLYGEYDIDRVINYFNTSGIVTFSNEPDKYYTYEILDEINFKKLIRWKTATVQFYVQPFKYSVLDTTRSMTSQIVKLGTGSKSLNGITCQWNGNNIILTGSASHDTSFYIPMRLTTIAGSYEVKVSSDRTYGNCEFRFCKASPINMQSLGEQFFSENSTTLIRTEKSDEYKYLHVFAPAGTESANIVIEVNAYQISITNRGNIYSRPVLNIYGSGQTKLAINGKEILSLEITDGNIIIDGERMNAYRGNVLYNRHVLGNYADLIFDVDENVISWTGNITRIDIDKYSRWI